MCVLYVCEKDVPELPVLVANGFVNNDGGGCAWIEGRRVHWRKGLKTAAELHEFVRNLPLPFIVHQRMRSAGPVCPELTHPFPVTKDVSVALEGSAKAVIAHNGTINWTADFEKAKKLGALPDDGPWSDTRFLAFMYALKGQKALKRYGAGQRIAVLRPDGATIVNPDQWRYTPKKTGGYWQSADYSGYADSFSIKSLPKPSLDNAQFNLLFK